MPAGKLTAQRKISDIVYGLVNFSTVSHPTEAGKLLVGLVMSEVHQGVEGLLD
jgi:hypothetical protein